MPVLSDLILFLGTSGSSGSAGTAIRLNSQDSTASVDDAGSPWNATRQTSISLREWDIPYEELKIADKIGSGRFSTGNFFGYFYAVIASLKSYGLILGTTKVY